MNLSSILVFTSAEHVPAVQARLNALPGIDVHYQCKGSGRLVVVQEASDDEAEMDGLRRIKALPHVFAAEMFYHYVDTDTPPSGQEGVTPC